ncbi:pirin family protein [Azospirillum picis]|uniref:Redox-sensitive bicupin YhaK (Pirin superfamily) n=1 Tax=Azospirillum picis TaxID=488438 RepID=A0ABU0MMA2_9PROT|nr:pirin family protein [Azospirillum picis]MBP2300631.1 redox-sensitive bicupin YhaK (pirin superfamily) [Azospirillum picis]MDQ0534600.1 redox-sensitive bicupin YhaK (pirin superfamily) [Azospirillum picis]
MITIRHRDERGVADMGWLNSHHTFSFGHYMDPAHMGFRALRVINEDRVAPGGGFPTHGHANMEIISYVLEGGLEHKDSIGTGSVIRPGEVQRMSAGRGIRHSEYNASGKNPVHFLQIWILPQANGLAPGYEQADFPAAEKRGKLRLVGSQDGRDGSVTIHQDVDLYATLLDDDESVTLPLRPGRHAWVQVARGHVTLNGQLLKAGDGAAVSNEEALTLDRGIGAEVLVFDLA